jgi:hypothetical protein
MIVTSGLGAICLVADHTSKAKRILFLGTVHTTLHHVDHYTVLGHRTHNFTLGLQVGSILRGSLFKKNIYLTEA